MTTKILLYNQAALHLGESRYSSLTEARESRYNLDTVYASVLQQMLEAGFWKFATRSVLITQDESIVPEFGYVMAHDKPDDWVKTYQVSDNEFFRPPLEDWIEEANLLFANVTPIYLRYVSNSTTGFGLDLSRWTARFERAVAFELAYRICPKTTGSTDSLKETLKKDAESALLSALSFEAMREPPKRAEPGRWVGSRGNSNTMRRVAGGYLPNG